MSDPNAGGGKTRGGHEQFQQVCCTLWLCLIHQRIMDMGEAVSPYNLNYIIIIKTYMCTLIISNRSNVSYSISGNRFDYKLSIMIKCGLFNLDEQICNAK